MSEQENMQHGLAAKVAAVQLAAQVSSLPKRDVTVTLKAKEGQTSGGQYSYSYIEEGTLMETIRPLLAEHGIAVFYSDEILDIKGNMASVRVTLTLVDGDSDDQFAMHAEGVGTDFGDKHVNKAKTAAMRYLLWKWFLVPSDVDPEEENVQRSAKPPRDQIKWATDADVEAFAQEIADAGFDKAAWLQNILTPHKAEWEGVRQDWLDKQRADLRRTVEQQRKAAE